MTCEKGKVQGQKGEAKEGSGKGALTEKRDEKYKM